MGRYRFNTKAEVPIYCSVDSGFKYPYFSIQSTMNSPVVNGEALLKYITSAYPKELGDTTVIYLTEQDFGKILHVWNPSMLREGGYFHGAD